MHDQPELEIPSNPHLRSTGWASKRFVVVYAAWLMIALGRAQTSPHQHPAPPPQPSPATGTSAPAHDHAGTAMPSAQPGHTMNMSFGPLSEMQQASGTAWQPESTPMFAQHSTMGDWQVMTHYNAFLAYEHQSGSRGDEQFNSINWLMLMATRRADENELMLRGMFSLEPWTTTAQGYPLLFQSGEAYHGRPLIDRQHPHDLFMELAGRYRRLVDAATVLSLYIAPAGEPALGPPAFMHRMSAMDNPAAPISHHWLDSTHISFGVITAGVARKTWQLEGSWFNGREPDEDRWDIEHPNLDSYSGRFTWNPSPAWSAQISRGYLKSSEELHPRDRVWRNTASVMHLTKLSHHAHIATTAAWGRNAGDHGTTDAFLAESSYVTGNMSFFGRAEYVEKTGEELDLSPSGRKIPVKQLTVGLTRELVKERPYQLALGGSVSYSFKPEDLDQIYGRNPIGFWVFFRLRPAAMEH